MNNQVTPAFVGGVICHLSQQYDFDDGFVLLAYKGHPPLVAKAKLSKVHSRKHLLNRTWVIQLPNRREILRATLYLRKRDFADDYYYPLMSPPPEEVQFSGNGRLAVTLSLE